MKYLLVALVVFFGFLMWQRNRASGRGADRAQQGQAPSARGATGQPQLMVRCAHCGLHFPQTDALSGRRGPYCSAAHRQLGEG